LPAGSKEKSPAAVQGAGPSLELKLKNPQSWFAAGNIILEIELSDPNSGAAIPDADVHAYLEHDGQRTPCGEADTDASGCATLRFPTPSSVPDGAFLVVRGADGTRYGELRFRMKAKPRENTPAPVGR